MRILRTAVAITLFMGHFGANAQAFHVAKTMSGLGIYYSVYPQGYDGRRSVGGLAEPSWFWQCYGYNYTGGSLGSQFAEAEAWGGAGPEVTAFTYSSTVSLSVYTYDDPVPGPQGLASWGCGASSQYIDVHTAVGTGGSGHANAGAYQHYSAYVSIGAPQTVSWTGSMTTYHDEGSDTWTTYVESTDPNHSPGEMIGSGPSGRRIYFTPSPSVRSGRWGGGHMSMTMSYQLQAIAQVDSSSANTTASAESRIAGGALGIEQASPY